MRASAAPPSLDLSAIDRFAAEQLAAQRVAGLALAITHGDQVVYVKGYGAAGDGQPVTPQTQFLIASVTKSLTALAIMQLVEQGNIVTDAPMQTYLPEVTLAAPDVAPGITVGQLLTDGCSRGKIRGVSSNGYRWRIPSEHLCRNAPTSRAVLVLIR